jgi:hypothetical protein
MLPLEWPMRSQGETAFTSWRARRSGRARYRELAKVGKVSRASV